MKAGLSPFERLHDKLVAARARGSGVHFSASDVDWLVLSGAYAQMLQAVARQAYVEARARVEKNGFELDPLLFGPTGPASSEREESIPSAKD